LDEIVGTDLFFNDFLDYEIVQFDYVKLKKIENF